MATNAAPKRTRRLPPARALSLELAELKQRSAARPITIREVIVTLRGRAYSLLVILLALPFTTPIPLPGLSTPFGLAIGFIALRLTLGQRPWLPKKLQRREIPPGFFAKLMTFTSRVLTFFEKFLRPRWLVVSGSTLLLRLHAVVMLAAAIGLLLPLPIPFTNTFPAWAILLLACGMLERDGLFIVLGYVVALAGVAYFFFLGEAAQELIRALVAWWRR